MSEVNSAGLPFVPVATLGDLNTLDSAEIVQGYRDYNEGDPEPGFNRGRAYWHGWCNRRRDEGHAEPTDESASLAHEYLAAERTKRFASGAA